MRRSDREVTQLNDIIEIMKKCDVCRLALNDGEYPYILPLNFGLSVKGTTVELYFHSATDGYKYEIIAKNNKASFEMDCEHNLSFDKALGYCTMNYESVIGQGHIEFLSESEKYSALQTLISQYHKDGFEFDKAAMSRTTVYKLVVDSMTGKIKQKKQ